MKKIKFLVAGSLVAAAIAFTPFSSFAAENNKIDYQNHGRFNLSSFFNNGFRGFEGFFLGNRVNAASTGSNNNNGSSSSSPIIIANRTPTISGITAPTVLKTGETGTWDIKASDPQNGSLSYNVDWGDQVASPLMSTMAKPFVQTSTFTHAYLNPGDYTVTFTVSNSAGLSTTSKVTVHVMGQAVAAPTISNISVSNISPTHVTLNWSTDVAASAFAWYGTTSPVDTSGTATVTGNGTAKNHTLYVGKLQPNTKYYFVVGSSTSGGTGMGTETSFTTAVADGTSPVITNLTGPAKVAAGATETVTVHAYDPKNGSLTYSADWGDTASTGMRAMAVPASIFVQSTDFTHVYTTPGTYTATFKAQNSAGITATSTKIITVTATTTTAPVISNISSQPGSTSSTITWTTNVPTTSQVFYSTTTPVDTTSSSATEVSDTTSSTTHSVSIPNLNGSTQYHFVIQSTDGSGNVGSSTESTFTTTS